MFYFRSERSVTTWQERSQRQSETVSELQRTISNLNVRFHAKIRNFLISYFSG